MPTATLAELRTGALDGARELSLREGLTAFPPEVFGLADTLEVLDLTGNALTTLPDDMGRFSRLRVLFCSGNRFERLPPSLGDCASLSQMGFRGCGMSEVPAESLPPKARWLTLTDNRIETLPKALGERPQLQKVMLAGNRLSRLPDSLAGAAGLELLRLSANRFEALPPWLAEMPRLAWLAWHGNPLDKASAPPPAVAVRWADLRLDALLGEGASGRIYRARWTPPAGETRAIALKLFKGAMTSDGLPEREMAACLASGEHPNLTGALGRLVDHPDGAEGLLMPLLPADWRVLAGPPSPEGCSRDDYDPALRLDPDVALRIAAGVGAAVAHLHGRGLSHGDVYAHNTLWDGATGQAVLSDFGAASFWPPGEGDGFEHLEVRAWGVLLGELLERIDGPKAPALEALVADCLQPEVRARPSLVQALDVLAVAGSGRP
jgi:hypothetical protein